MSRELLAAGFFTVQPKNIDIVSEDTRRPKVFSLSLFTKNYDKKQLQSVFSSLILQYMENFQKKTWKALDMGLEEFSLAP